jgi:hypothetical protein
MPADFMYTVMRQAFPPAHKTKFVKNNKNIPMTGLKRKKIIYTSIL